MKLIRKLGDADSGFSSKVYFDSELEEYTARLFFDGVELEESAYFTDDKADELATAEIMTDRAN